MTDLWFLPSFPPYRCKLQKSKILMYISLTSHWLKIHETLMWFVKFHSARNFDCVCKSFAKLVADCGRGTAPLFIQTRSNHSVLVSNLKALLYKGYIVVKYLKNYRHSEKGEKGYVFAHATWRGRECFAFTVYASCTCIYQTTITSKMSRMLLQTCILVLYV